MKITPKTEKQIEEEMLFAAGNYEVEVIKCEEQVSKGGNAMLKLMLRVYMPDGTTRTMFDYLLEAMAFKLRHFMVSAGMEDKYNQGDVTSDDLMGAMVLAEIGIKPAKDGYAAQNNITDYMPIKRSGAAATSRVGPVGSVVGSAIKDEDIPF